MGGGAGLKSQQCRIMVTVMIMIMRGPGLKVSDKEGY